jgi:hypothetical protein
VVFLWALPQLWEAAAGPVEQALPLLFDARAPHHFRPTLAEVAPFFAWQAAAWIALWADDEPLLSTTVGRRHLAALLASLGGVVMLASLLTTVVFVPTVAQLFPWRLAPFATLLAMAAVVGAVVRHVDRAPAFAPSQTRGARRRGAALAVAGALAIFGARVTYVDRELTMAVAGAAALVLTLAVLWRARANVVLLWGAAAVLLLAAVIGVRDLRLDVKPPAADVRRLARWAEEHTDKAALFVVPPELVEFRLVVRRSIVVDWKSAGMLPKDVVAWADRLSSVTGVPVQSRDQVRRAYAAMSAEQAREVLDSFDADYIVFDKRDGAPPALGEPFYANGRYAVFKR